MASRTRSESVEQSFLVHPQEPLLQVVPAKAGCQPGRGNRPRRVDRRLPSERVSRRERLGIEYAELMTRDANRIPDPFFERLRAAFTASEIVELTFMVGLITLLNRFNNALQVRYQSEFTDVVVR